MSERVRYVTGGECCVKCDQIAWGGEKWHPVRDGVECPSCHAVAFDPPRVAPVVRHWRVIRKPRPRPC